MIGVRFSTGKRSSLFIRTSAIHIDHKTVLIWVSIALLVLAGSQNWVFEYNSVEGGQTAFELHRAATTDLPVLIQWNSIFNIGEYLIYGLERTTNVSAKYNWWGTSEINVIESMIIDGNDNFRIGFFDIEPILQSGEGAGPRE